jgi:hypothetical protein
MSTASRRSMTEIEAEIARTRVELDLTLDSLAADLAPGHLVEKAANMVKKSWCSKRAGGIDLGAGVRADPVPLALIGLSAAWLIAENSGLLGKVAPSRGENTTVEETGSDDAVPASRGNGSIAQAAAPAVLRPIDEGNGAALERAGKSTGPAATLDKHACRAGRPPTDGVKRNPLLLGLAGIACGAVIAMLLPSSRREQQLVARARDDLWKNAEDLGHCAADKVRAMASTPTGTAAEG